MDHVTEMFEQKGSPVLWTRCGSVFFASETCYQEEYQKGYLEVAGLAG